MQGVTDNEEVGPLGVPGWTGVGIVVGSVCTVRRQRPSLVGVGKATAEADTQQLETTAVGCG